jgi:hypothetical protein
MRRLILAGAIGLVGCPSEDEASDGDTGGGSDTGGSGSDSGSGSASQTLSGSETAGYTVAETAGDTGASTGASTGGGSTDAGDSTDGTDACIGLDRKACSMNPDCAAIACGPIVPDESTAGFCLGGDEFLGCQDAHTVCDQVRTFTCMGDDAPVYVCPSACIPEDWMECPSPVDGQIMTCA